MKAQKAQVCYMKDQVSSGNFVRVEENKWQQEKGTTQDINFYLALNTLTSRKVGGQEVRITSRTKTSNCKSGPQFRRSKLTKKGFEGLY